MKGSWKLLMILAVVFMASSCATVKEKFPLGIEETAQRFFNDLQKSDHKGAYGLFSKGLSNAVSFSQFDDFMNTLREQWGRVESEETTLMPFHPRQGEENFIPLHTAPAEIKRYTFDVKYEAAEMNFDLTLAPENGENKIIWFSLWGSSNYLTPKIREELEKLFSKADQ